MIADPIKSTYSLSFDDTKTAFHYKNNSELRKANFLFSMMSKNWLVKIGTKLTPLAFKLSLPIKAMVRATIYDQFCGGETLDECVKVIDTLAKYNAGTILDYGVEGKESEDEFDKATNAFINGIKFAGAHPSVPFISVKVTGISNFALLEKLNDKKNILTEVDTVAWNRVKGRMHRICKAAYENKVSVMIDAEESWIQNPVDDLAEEMMKFYNKEGAVVINTIQLYRHDRLQFLKDSFKRLETSNIICGFKLVRGAYMEKERKRSAHLFQLSPIQINKQNTDRDYNLAIDFCLDNIDKLLFCVASHNEESNLKAATGAAAKGIASNHKHLHFSQLYGMSDNITFNLAHAGFNVTKYLPYGPVKDVVPYLMRRAEENTSVKGQSSRELMLIKKELKRRSG